MKKMLGVLLVVTLVCASSFAQQKEETAPLIGDKVAQELLTKQRDQARLVAQIQMLQAQVASLDAENNKLVKEIGDIVDKLNKDIDPKKWVFDAQSLKYKKAESGSDKSNSKQ